MMFSNFRKRPVSRPRLVALAGALLGAALAANHAGAQGFNPYGVFTDSGPATPEDKVRRERVRTDLYIGTRLPCTWTCHS